MIIERLKKNEMAISRKVNRVSPDLFGYVDYCIQNDLNGVVGYETIDGNQVIFISTSFINDYIFDSSEMSNLMILEDRLQNYFKKVVNLSPEEKYQSIISGEFVERLKSLMKKEQNQLDVISNLISDLFDGIKEYNENLGFEFKYNEASQSETINKDFLQYVKGSKFYKCERNGYGDLFLTDKQYHDYFRWTSKYYLLREVADYFTEQYHHWYKTQIYVVRNLNRLAQRFRGANAPLLVFDIDTSLESLDDVLSDLRSVFDIEHRGTGLYSLQSIFESDFKFVSSDGVDCTYTLSLRIVGDDNLRVSLYSDSQDISGKNLEN